MTPVLLLQPMPVSSALKASFSSPGDFERCPSPSATLPSAAEPLPPVGSERWALWSGAVLAESRQAMGVISSRRWTVVHPDDIPMLALLALIDADEWSDRGMETPHVIRWLAKSDGRAYTLVEFFSLTRQPALSVRPSASERAQS